MGQESGSKNLFPCCIGLWLWHCTIPPVTKCRQLVSLIPARAFYNVWLVTRRWQCDLSVPSNIVFHSVCAWTLAISFRIFTAENSPFSLNYSGKDYRFTVFCQGAEAIEIRSKTSIFECQPSLGKGLIGCFIGWQHKLYYFLSANILPFISFNCKL